MVDWNDMERIWKYEFRITPECHNFLLTEAPLNPKNNREKMVSIMFETFKVHGLFIACTSVLALLATGRTNGIVVDSGDGVTNVVPIFGAMTVRHAVVRMNQAGRDITEYLVKILCERGYEMTTSAEREIVRELKEKLCFVAFDYEEELTKEETTGVHEMEYTLPDGSKMTVGSERFRAPEIMFKPSFIGSEIEGVHESCFNSIQKCDRDMRKMLYKNIVPAGGSTMFKGFNERMEDEIQKMAPKRASVRVVETPNEKRQNLVFIGASILTSIPGFGQMLITKEQYDEHGSVIVHRKCLM